MKPTILIAFFLTILYCSVYAQSGLDESTYQKLSERLNDLHNIGLLSGNVLVAQDNQVIFKESYGLANYEWKIPNTSETKTDIGSISKQFTATLILKLCQNDQLSLNKDIGNYLPQLSANWSKEVTIHHLLSHTSGLQRRIWFDHTQEETHTEKENIEQINNMQLLFEPGSEFSYSNAGYYLLHLIAEVVTEKDFEQLMQEMIFEPANLNHTGFINNYSIVEQMASGYMIVLGEAYRPAHHNYSNSTGAGGIHSTTEDLFLWDQALRSYSILDSFYTEKLYTVNQKGYGYGWYSKDLSKDINVLNRKVEHYGDTPGFSSSFTRYLESNFVVIILGNQEAIRRSLILTNIIRILNNQPIRPVVSVAKKYYDELVKPDIDLKTLASELKKEKQKKAAIDIPNYMDFFNQGSKLYSLGRWPEALNFFKFMNTLAPNRYLGYFALGQHYYEMGDHKRAITYLTSALEKKPSDNNIIKLLEDIKSKE